MDKAFVFILCLIAVFITCNTDAAEYSLDDLYRLALERSETIKVSEEDLYISGKDKDRAVAALMPTLSAFGNHIRYTEDKSTSIGILQPEYMNAWGVRLDQTLSLSARELTAFKIAKQGIKRGEFSLDAVKEEYLLNVASAYYDVLKAKKALEIADTNVKRLTKHRDASKKRLEVGEATKTVLLRAEAELAGAQSDRIKSENSLRLARVVLTRTVGINEDITINDPQALDPDNTGVSSISDIIGDCSLSVLECLKEKAFAERAEIRDFAIQKEIAENEVKYARGAYWPDLSLEGVYLRQENEPSSTFELKERIFGAVKLNFPFFEGGLRVAEVSQAKARLRQSEYNLSDIKKSLTVEIEDSYLNLMTTSSIISSLRAEVSYAGDNFHSITKQFQYGLADSVDIIDANTLLLTAEKELANAEYDYQLAVWKVKRSTGTLLKAVVSAP